ncbi:alkaline phosphatase D [Parvibaculum indicum]|uniref:alkaline phosphatase D family protein n=1 Tax=Parvibaculum indicum TaxID=562969 RepID=UPI0014242BCD|nr:alkaline phosphatase D family protein [Parvibaculum indicum]NIJ39821.1 alkaline phosphatase D [Parvibaculum indicum]
MLRRDGARPSRRDFLKLFGAAAGCYALTASPIPFLARLNRADAAPGQFHFPQGLASADPQPDAVLLWTRVARIAGDDAPVAQPLNGAIDLYVQVARDEAFESLVLERTVRAPAETDHTVRLLVDGLQPDTIYYYRFYAGGDTSPLIGRTRTAPSPDADRPVRFAAVACQNYEQGFYGAWRRLVNDDIAAPPERQLDFVLHLGDFIYEVAGDVPQEETPARLVGHMPDGSAPWEPDGTHPWWQRGAQAAVTLDDYRYLYKTYLSDPDLQAARARFPIIAIWDDHEFSNNGWQSAATYFEDATPAQRRKLAANAAWFEFVPAILTDASTIGDIPSSARDFAQAELEDGPFGDPDDGFLLQDANNLAALRSITIYRAVKWGAMLDLILTDLRSYRSPPVMTREIEDLTKGAPLPPVDLVKTLDSGRLANDGNPPETISHGDREIPNPRRNMPPGTQMGVDQKHWFKQVLKASTARWRFWASSVPALSMRLDLSSVPMAGYRDGYVGADGWQGYPGELRELMAYVRANGIPNLVTLSGDYHAFAAGRLPVDPDAEKLAFPAAEFMTAAISSGDMFSSVERTARGSDTFYRVAVMKDADGKELANWNNTLVNGFRAGLVTSYAGKGWGDWFVNERASPGLSYVDSRGHGFSLVTVTESAVVVEQVNVGGVSHDAGPAGPDILRKARFVVKSWGPGEDAAIEGPLFTGEPPYPYSE